MLATSTKGRLLVATPMLGEGIFDRSVVLMLEHDEEEGALGLVLNKPSTTDVAEPLPFWAPLAASPSVVFVGGPVSPDAAVCLARVSNPAVDGWTPLVAGLGSLDLTTDPDVVGGGVQQLRVYSGYAGWTAGQLEGEIEAGAWFVVDTQDGDVLSDDPDTLWQRVLKRQPGRLSLFAAYPDDPSAN